VRVLQAPIWFGRLHCLSIMTKANANLSDGFIERRLQYLETMATAHAAESLKGMRMRGCDHGMLLSWSNYACSFPLHVITIVCCHEVKEWLPLSSRST